MDQQPRRFASRMTAWVAVCLMAGLALAATSTIAAAQSVADFYGKQRISLMISSGVGGGYDLYGRTVARFMGEHIPGKPSIIPQNKPGAGGMKLLNFAFNKAPKDGSVIFTLHIGLPLHQVLGGRGVRYDAGKLIGIGRVAAGNAVTGVWHKTGVQTFADLSKKRVTLGSTGASSVSSMRMRAL